jgi:acyl dehydratase
MSTIHYIDDLKPGQRFGSGRFLMDATDIKRFAAEFDPQPFHLDEDAAKTTLFQGLAASGWHTASVTMRLFFESEFKPAGGIIGAGLDELKWYQPVRADDELYLEIEILEVKPSKSRPEQGMVKARVTTFKNPGNVVQVFVANLIVKRKIVQ